MKIYHLLGLGTLAAAALLSSPERGKAQAEPGQDGMEVLARGPVHEAFAEPGAGEPVPSPILAKKPPAPIEEMPPDQKPEGDNVQWLAGYWAFDDAKNDFVWISGFWRAFPPGRQWTPGYWTEVANGFQWVPGFWGAAGNTQTEFLPPPPPSIDTGPSTPAPAIDSGYVPGSWVFRDTRYWWRPGYWLPYNAGWVWQPAHYVWTPAGYLFVDGYWDFPLRRRGLLFAPVYFTRNLWSRPGWFYRPSYVVSDDFLMSSLFVRPGYGYYFGNYFDPIFARRGFVPWLDYRYGRAGYDPLYGYYRWHNRNNRLWERDLVALYKGRIAGTVPRPPVTLVQQTQILKTTPGKNPHLQGLTLLAKVDPQIVKIKPVPANRLAEQRKAAEQLRQASVQRQRLDASFKGAPLKSTDAPRVIKTPLPGVSGGKTTLKAPMNPTEPKRIDKPIPRFEPKKPTIIKPDPVIVPKPGDKPKGGDTKPKGGDPKPKGGDTKPKTTSKPDFNEPYRGLIDTPRPRPGSSDPKPAPKPSDKPAPKASDKSTPKAGFGGGKSATFVTPTDRGNPGKALPDRQSRSAESKTIPHPSSSGDGPKSGHRK